MAEDNHTTNVYSKTNTFFLIGAAFVLGGVASYLDPILSIMIGMVIILIAGIKDSAR